METYTQNPDSTVTITQTTEQIVSLDDLKDSLLDQGRQLTIEVQNINARIDEFNQKVETINQSITTLN